MRSKGSIIAGEIDREYKLRKMYELKRKRNCIKKCPCKDCQYKNICKENDKKDEV